MAANFNALLDKCEDPSKMIDQTLRNLNENLAEVTKETAGVVAEEKRAERELNALQDKLTTWDARARKALASGNEGDAPSLTDSESNSASAIAVSKSLSTLASKSSNFLKVPAAFTPDAILLMDFWALTWDARARKALASGNEGDARTFLTEKAGVQAKYDEAKRVYDVAHSNAPAPFRPSA